MNTLKEMEKLQDHVQKELKRYNKAHNELITESLKLLEENRKLKARNAELERPLKFRRHDNG